MAKDWVGKTVGKLTFVAPTEKRSGRSVVWEAKCECGETHYCVPGRTQSCGCSRQDDFDWSGFKFNRLTIISRTTSQRRGTYLWQAKCDCGSIVLVTPNNVAKGRVKSCGCIIRTDFTGVKRCMLTFIKPVGQTPSGSVIWAAICDCGKATQVIPANVRIEKGGIQSCGCLLLVAAKNNGSINGRKARKYHPLISSARNAWKSHYRDCEFELFLRLSQLPCTYCGAPPSNRCNAIKTANSQYMKDQQEKGWFVYNGLDRLDSNKGHTPDNVVPCCITCNRAKMDLSLNDFLKHIETIYKHMYRFIQQSSGNRERTLVINSSDLLWNVQYTLGAVG